jgi:spermidine/putrescine transport system permease protein
MQAALPTPPEAKGPQQQPRWRAWLLMSPMLLWLVAFVVLPTAILLVYSFCERGEGAPVAYRFTLENYKRIVVDDDTTFDSAYWKLATGVIVKAVAIGLAFSAAWGGGVWWFGESRPRLARLALLAAVVALFFGLRMGADAGVLAGYAKILARSIWYAGLTTGICVVLGYPVAYFIGRASEARRNQLLMLVMVPFWTSFLIRTYAWINILNEEGLLNSLLQYTHIISAPLPILYTPTAVVIGLVYSYLPFMILPIYGSVEKLDNSLVEAAFDLGAGPIRAFSSVVIPLTSPGIIAGTLLVFIPAIGMFAITELMGGGQVPMVGNVIQNQFLQARDWPFGSALGMTLLILFAVAFWFTTRKQGDASVMG